MEQSTDCIQEAGFSFIANFDSGNLARVELVPKLPVVPNVPKKSTTSNLRQEPVKSSKTPPEAPPDFEFNVWTKPDCYGTQYENASRTWFYFGIRGGPPFSLVKLNIVDLNKQGRMYRDGMAPVFRVGPGRPWERIRDRPTYSTDNNVFTLRFKYRTLESPKAIIYFSFTYPFSYSEGQALLSSIDHKLRKQEIPHPMADMQFSKGLKISVDPEDAIYYQREIVCRTLDGRNVDLITISSHHNILPDREPRLANLFPDENAQRCFKFRSKKVIFFSARVHPGETPSSFVLNGLLNLLTSRDDPIALLLRRQYVFKLIPMLNPDGVARGHYRTDARGVNLNRCYLQPDLELQPSIYAARSLIRYYHFGEEIYDGALETQNSNLTQTGGHCSPEPITSSTSSMETLPMQDLSLKSSHSSLCSEAPNQSSFQQKLRPIAISEGMAAESGLFLYMDIHGHASKKGIFMYGNHFNRTEDMVECMLFPKIISLNSQHFHFGSCNFTERNMYLRDKRDGASREGSGRVAVLGLTGLIRSYTLECNYNTGRIVNVLPPCLRELPGRPPTHFVSPPKYTTAIYEEMGRSIGISILDMTNSNPWSRISNSDYHNLAGLREWLRVKSLSENIPVVTSTAPKIRRSTQVITALRPPKSALKVPTSSTHKTHDVAKTAPGPKEAPTQSEAATQVQRPAAGASVRKIVKSLRPGERQIKAASRTSDKISDSRIEAVTAIVESVEDPSSSEGCALKLSPKRLKTCGGELGARLVGTSSDPCLSSSKSIKSLKSSKPQLSPLRYKKSLEKRRSSDRKTKALYKKTSKLAISASELSKADRKRRNIK